MPKITGPLLEYDQAPPRRRRDRLFKIAGLMFALFILAAILVPWIEAYRSNQSMTYLYSDINGRNIDCMVVDGCFFDRYYCLLFDESAIGQVRENNGKIVLNGKPMQFPRGTNVGFLQSDGKIQFAWLNPNDITPIHAGRSEIYYIFGKIPSLKHFPSGVPRVDLVLQRTQNWK